MFYFNIAIYLTILLSIIGCDCTRLSEASFTNLKPNQDKGDPVIVLFHGLGSVASCFNSLKEELKQAFPRAFVVALTSVEKVNTAVNSIKEQANSSFEELSKMIPDLQNRPTLLIGHSQGGLRAYKMFDTYNDLLNVKGIITLATPWEGSPALNADQNLFSEYCQNPAVLDDMQNFSIAYNKNKNFLSEYLQEKIQNFKKINSCYGIIALKPKSEFLNGVANTLPSVVIPMLAIGGAQSDFRVFLPKESRHDFKALREAWTKIIIGTMYHGKNKEHDMVVPLYSQIALNIVPPGNKNFKRVLIRDALHDEVLSLPPDTKSLNILEHSHTFDEIKKFARSVLYEASNQKTNKSESMVAAA